MLALLPFCRRDLRTKAAQVIYASDACGSGYAVGRCRSTAEEVQQMLNNVAIAKVGNNITGIKRLVEKKVGLLGRTLCLEPLPTDEGEQGNRGVMALRVRRT